MASTAVAKAGSDRNRTFLAILIPVLILFCAFNTIPLLTGFFYSFTDSKGYGAFEIVGLQNYIDLFQDARVGNSYLFTFKIAVVSTILVNVISLMLAIASRARSSSRAPCAASTSCPASSAASSSATCSATSSPTSSPPSPARPRCSRAPSGRGWPSSWSSCGRPAPRPRSSTSPASHRCPRTSYEAGALDGATGWDKFRYLTFPLIMPSITTNMVLVMKDMLMTFDQIVAMTSGGPAQSTESISYLIYQNGLNNSQFGFQCANAVIFFIVIAVISIAQTKFLNSKEEQL